MTVDRLVKFLGWWTVTNFSLFLWWFFLISFAHDWVSHIHATWLLLNIERFDAIHYAGMTFFKISIILFNVVPYLALRIII